MNKNKKVNPLEKDITAFEKMQSNRDYGFPG
jgi:hypothetical protein